MKAATYIGVFSGIVISAASGPILALGHNKTFQLSDVVAIAMSTAGGIIIGGALALSPGGKE